MKVKSKIIFSILVFSFIASSASASILDPGYGQPLKEAYIKYEQISWQTYEFYVATNLVETGGLQYEWDIDGQEMFNSSRVRYFFEKGDHHVKVKVEDRFGNVRYDSVLLSIRFWSLRNNWFWWVVYLVIISLVVYYWIVKIIYLLNRNKVSKDVRYFMDILDEHGWVERAVEKHLRQKNNKTKKQ